MTKASCSPVAVVDLDIVGYLGGGEFVILNPVRSTGRELPDFGELSHLPFAIPAVIHNNQAVNFEGKKSTLHDICGAWFVRPCDDFDLRDDPVVDLRALRTLQPSTFFEIGHVK